MPHLPETLVAPRPEFRALMASLGISFAAFCREVPISRTTLEEALRFGRMRRYNAARVAAAYGRLAGISTDEAMAKLFQEYKPRPPLPETSSA